DRPLNVQAERLDRALDDLARHACVEQRADKHVARDSGWTIDVQVQSLHHDPPGIGVRPSIFRFMSAAAKPAPKPLSMLTTVTPDAQEFSIAKSAAMPPKLAPYPMLVGTAITGFCTSPPTTLGSAPSMPAQTMRTSARSSTSRCASSRWMPATPTSKHRSTR